MSTPKRDISSYLQAARELAPFITSLTKYKRRKKNLTPQEKSAIARAERLFARSHADHLIPVDTRTAKDLGAELFEFTETTTIKKGPNKGKPITRKHRFQAIQLRNTSPKATFKRLNRNMIVETNGRLWVYWKLRDKSVPAVEEAGSRAFQDDIEAVIELAREAFDQPTCKGVYLWAQSGRVGEGTKTLSEFVQWVYESYSHYVDTNKWMKGIAILIADVGDYVSPAEYRKFGTRPTKRIRRKKDGSYY